MKQIKTICIRLNAAKDFDHQVNEAIEEGWALIERKVLQPHTEDKYTMLYAELERFTEPDETEDNPWTNLIENFAAFVGAMSEKAKPKEEPVVHCCANCKHCDTPGTSYPCINCKDVSQWEPVEGETCQK